MGGEDCIARTFVMIHQAQRHSTTQKELEYRGPSVGRAGSHVLAKSRLSGCFWILGCTLALGRKRTVVVFLVRNVLGSAAHAGEDSTRPIP